MPDTPKETFGVSIFVESERESDPDSKGNNPASDPKINLIWIAEGQ